MTLIDTHAHLDEEQYSADIEDVIARSVAAGVEAIICVGITADSSEAVVRLAESHDTIYAAVGIQPNYCNEAGADDWDRIVRLVDHPRVVAVGETGLDRHWDFTPFDIQEDYFDRHLRLASECNLPVIVHCRECEPDVAPMLRDAAARGPLQGVLHAFSGTAQMAKTCLEIGFFVSFAGNVTYTNKKFQPLRDVAKTVPADRLLLETDSPYMVPHPLRGKQKRNEPAEIALTAASLAELRNEPVETLSKQTTDNARRLFRLS